MGYSHILTILDDALQAIARDDSIPRDELVRMIGEQVVTLCKRHQNPIFPSKDSRCGTIGDWVGGIAWCGMPATARDELFYWGAHLKPLRDVSDAELAHAEMLLNREKQRRGGGD